MLERSYRQFQLVIARTSRILKYGVSGIEQQSVQIEKILGKISMTNGVHHNQDPKESAESTRERVISIELTRNELRLLRKVLKTDLKMTDELRNHLYSLLLVYIWGAFEAYIVMLFEDLFKLKPEMLKSKDSISMENILENKEKIIEFLVEKELEKIGHYNFSELLDYLKRKINFSFSASKQERLGKTYLTRNIIAHSTGIVAARYKNRISESIKLRQNEILLSQTYLKKEILNISSAVNLIERHVKKKFGK